MAVLRIRTIVNSPSFFPEYERKSKLKRYIENYKWLFKYGKHNPSYNLFGLDVVGLRNFDDYADVRYIKKDRMKKHHSDEAMASHRDENLTIRYSVLADNKQVFYSYIEKMNPDLVPTTYLIIQGDKVLSPFYYDKEIASIDQLKTLEDGKYICKPVVGSFGDSISVLEKKGDELIVNNGEFTIDELISQTEVEPFLIQEYIVQHEKISKLNKSTVNTLRIISTRWNEDTHILAGMMRIGTEGKLVDNSSAGGTFVGIDIESGKLMEYGYYYDKIREKSHPDSGVIYKDYEIPYWDETIKLIKKLHPIIFGFATLGWDIAITEEGPVIVEINWNYSVKGIQIACGGLKTLWDKLKDR